MSHVYTLLPFFMFALLAAGTSLAQLPVSIFGASTPGIVDGGDPQPVVLGVKIFADVPGQVLGCSFYKAATNAGVHVVSLWDSSGNLLASQSASGETVSGKQTVIFSSPVTVAANQMFTCGYFAPMGHFSNDRNAFTAQKDVTPLHVPVNGGVFVYGTQSTRWPTSTWTASNYWVDVLFVPANLPPNWIGGVKVSLTGNTASISWTTAVPADSQVEYGPTALYGNITALATARVTSHVVAIQSLPAASTYHFRVRCRDSDGVLVIGTDHTFVTAQVVSAVEISPVVTLQTINSQPSPPMPHAVSLFWRASLDSHIVSYSMYRSTVSGSSYGLSASAIGGLTFIDQSVQSGTTYYYVITAVDDQGRESAFSNETMAAIP